MSFDDTVFLRCMKKLWKNGGRKEKEEKGKRKRKKEVGRRKEGGR